MAITSRVRTTFFVPTSARSQALIRLPPSVVIQYETKSERSGKVIATCEKPPHRANIWSSEEHERFLQGLELWPNGPWKEVAANVGTKTTRQTMTHAQKYRQKIERRQTKKRADLTPVRQLGPCHSQPEFSINYRAVPRLKLIDESYNECGQVIARLEANEYVLCSSTSTHHYFVSSPMEVSDDNLDSTHFDQDFDNLLECLGALPTAQNWPRYRP